MSWFISALLVTYAVTLGLVLTRLLERARWVLRRPRLGLQMWHWTAIGVVVALSGAALLVAHDVLEHVLLAMLAAEKADLHRAYAGSAVVPKLWNLAAIVPVLLIAAVVMRFVALAMSDRRRRRALRRRLTAASSARIGEAQVIRSDVPTAFCIPGRHPLVVVTAATVEMLDTREVEAVLDHEREHLKRRHALQITVAEAVGGILGRLGLLRGYATQVRRLAELAADDAASHRHGSSTVASALIAMAASPVRHSPSMPVLAMAAVDTTERIHRLMIPAATSYRSGLGVLGLTVAAFPVAAVLLPAAAMLITRG